MENYKDIINSINPYPQAQYQQISSNEKLMAYATYFLEKNDIPITNNNIYLVTFKFFPENFIEDKDFPNFPSVDVLARTYMHLKYTGKTKPSYITGTTKEGFKLTSYGRAVAIETGNIINNTKIDSSVDVPITARRKVTSKSDLDYKNFIESECFHFFKATETLNLKLLWLYFNVIPFTEIERIKEKITLIKKYAASIDDSVCVNCCNQILEELQNGK